ncbi:MAG: thiamine diphosphokinase, partial [Desulfamplus sp.]|nr:thiamine diphosphokinase [Desulfamplus sp.]
MNIGTIQGTWLIVANGTISDDALLTSLVQNSHFIVCADGGARHLRRVGISPDFLVGDMDSIQRDILDENIAGHVKLRSYPSRKDNSDTELAVDLAIEQGASRIVLTGVTGTRMDHTLANIFLLKRILSMGIPACIVDDHNEIYMLFHDMPVIGMGSNHDMPASDTGSNHDMPASNMGSN